MTKKYEILNTLFAILLMAFAIISTFKISHLALTLIPVAYIVVFKKTKYYSWFIFIGGIIIISVIASIMMGEFDWKNDLLAVCGFILMAVTCIFAGIFLPGRITPGPDYKKIKENKNNH